MHHLSYKGSPTHRFWPLKAIGPLEGRDKGFQCRFMTSALVPVIFLEQRCFLYCAVCHTRDNAWLKAFFHSTLKLQDHLQPYRTILMRLLPHAQPLLTWLESLLPRVQLFQYVLCIYFQHRVGSMTMTAQISFDLL